MGSQAQAPTANPGATDKQKAAGLASWAQGMQSNPLSQAQALWMPAPPQAPDFVAGAQQQTQANRPDQTNAFGSGVEWTQAPDGSWHQKQSFGGAMGGAASSLQAQLGRLSAPMDWEQFGKLGTGDEARKQAIDAAYGEATKRLNPAWAQREDQLKTQLTNQGLDPNSQAGRAAMAEMNAARNDAYGSAMNSAIAQGQSAGDSVFRNNMLARQQAIAEALRERGMPVSELQQLQGFLAQPGFATDNNLLQALLAKSQYDMGVWQGNNDRTADLVGGATDLATSFIPGKFGK